MKLIRETSAFLAALSMAGCNPAQTMEPVEPVPMPTSILAIVTDTPTVSSTGTSTLRDTSTDAPISRTTGDKTVTASVLHNLQSNAEDLEITALSRTTTFTNADLSADGITYSKLLDDGVTRVSFSSLDGTWSAVKEGSSRFKAMIRYGYEETASNLNTQNLIYGVFGEPTPTALLPTTGKASFSGDAIGQVTVMDVTNGVLNHSTSSAYKADVALSVDFARPSIGGSLKNVTYDGVAQPEEFTIVSSALTNGSFQTTIVFDPTSCRVQCSSPFEPDSSSLSGQVFGDDAREVGGAFAMQRDQASARGQLKVTTISGAFAAAR